VPVCLLNGNVVTDGPVQPRAQAVAIAGGRITSVGTNAEAKAAAGPGARVIDCAGGTVLPGFIDAHIHLLALARRASNVDLSPARVDSVAALCDEVGSAAARTPPGCWVRGSGYDEFYLRERRHPTRHDLDRVARGRPVRVRHRSRHASVLNSAALRIVAERDADLLGAAGVERDATGMPTGVLYDLDAPLAAVVPRPGPVELRAGLAAASAELLAAGVTRVDDATPSTGPEELHVLRRAAADGILRQRLRVFWGAQQHGMPRDPTVSTVKLMLREGVGRDPDFEDMLEMAHRRGLQVAVHAVEGSAIAVAIAGFEAVLQRWPRPHRHRIEHCALCPVPLMDRMAELGIVVVSQPGFLQHVGDRYVADVPVAEQPWLYPLRALRARGVSLAGSSDAPVGPLAPLVGISAAVTRRSSRGTVVTVNEALPLDEALRLYGTGAAYATCAEGVCGRLAVGFAGDVIVLERDLSGVAAECLPDVSVSTVLIAGEAVLGADARANGIEGVHRGRNEASV
jgi:predicted amidohydrolase YtcJ